MKIPPLFKQLLQKRKELNEEFKLMGLVAVPENYTLENFVVADDMEKTLHEMLDLIEQIKHSQRSLNRGQTLPSDSARRLMEGRLHDRAIEVGKTTKKKGGLNNKGSAREGLAGPFSFAKAKT
jgi:hypothetical protein